MHLMSFRLKQFRGAFRRFSTSLEERYADLVREAGLQDYASTSQSVDGHDVLVIHPKIRWGENSAPIHSEAGRELEEAVSLVNTIPKMRVANSVIVGTDYNTKKKTIWGSGRIESLLHLKEQFRVSALMINVDQLSPMQQSALYEIFGVPIFDRYNIVLNIFKHYAHTPESRLQIQLAEIPYIKRRLRHVLSSPVMASVLHVQQQTDNGADKFELLRMKEQSLRKKLKETIAEGEMKTIQEVSEGALVAVVGYTNAGKTSLVKRLTGANSLQPLDRLFATLDTTRHIARLPSGRKTIFADTIGFLSNLPVHLLAAFEATLGHVKMADVIIHMRDVSHPQWRLQSEEVISTLRRIGVRQNQAMITVNNKIDRLDLPFESDIPSAVPISCTTGDGMESLITCIDRFVLTVSNCKPRRLALRFDSPSIHYLYSNGFVTAEPITTDTHLKFDVFMTDVEFERFQKHMGQMRKRTSTISSL